MNKTGKKTDHQTTLAPYLAVARAREPLTREDERALATRARTGDLRARDELARQNLHLVLAVARQQSRGTLPLEELVQEGNLGLLRAIEKFDPKAGTRFSTYAVWWIRAYVWKYLKQARSAVRPRSGDVALADVSLDAPLDEEGDSSWLDRVEDDAPRPDQAYSVAEGSARVRASLEKVRARVGPLGWDIIHSRLQQEPPDTLETIGARWGLSRERVRQVELQTKQFLRRHLAAEEAVADGSLREAA